MDALKFKTKGKVFLCNGIAQIINEFYGASRKQLIIKFKKKHSPALNGGRKSYTLTTLSQDPYLIWFLVFGRSSPQLLAFYMILAEFKQLLEFRVMGKSTLRKWCKKLGFCYKRRNKNVKNASVSTSWCLYCASNPQLY